MLPRTYMKALRISKQNDGKINRDAALVAAFWFLYETYSGQFSREYAELCWLGSYYQPNMECGPEEGSWEQCIYTELVGSKS